MFLKTILKRVRGRKGKKSVCWKLCGFRCHGRNHGKHRDKMQSTKVAAVSWVQRKPRSATRNRRHCIKFATNSITDIWSSRRSRSRELVGRCARSEINRATRSFGRAVDDAVDGDDDKDRRNQGDDNHGECGSEDDDGGVQAVGPRSMRQRSFRGD